MLLAEADGTASVPHESIDRCTRLSRNFCRSPCTSTCIVARSWCCLCAPPATVLIMSGNAQVACMRCW